MGESSGWGGEFHLHNGSALTELVNVTACGLPEDRVDEIETTTLKAVGRRKTFIPGLIDGGSFDVEMNYIPNSADDQLCLAAKIAGDTRPWKIVVPDDDGTELRQFTGNGWVKGYKIEKLSPGEGMKCVLTVRVTGAVTEAAYS